MLNLSRTGTWCLTEWELLHRHGTKAFSDTEMLYTSVQLSPLLVLASLGELALFSPAIEELLLCGRELGMNEKKKNFVARCY